MAKTKLSKTVTSKSKKKLAVDKVDISVSIVGHNEGYHLQELLPTLTWAKEVIYVDCESNDDSLKVARKYGCRIFQKKNNPNINVNKEFGIKQAKGSWVLYLDPDERLSGDFVTELKELSLGKHNYNAFRMNRKNFIIDRFLGYGDVYPDTQLRFFKNGLAGFPQRHVHEFLQVQGEVGKLKHDMLHYPYLSINQLLKKFDFYTSFEASCMFEKKVRLSWSNALLFMVLKPMHLFFLKFFIKKSFLDGYPGMIFSFISALHFPVRYFKLWELYVKKNKSPNKSK